VLADLDNSVAPGVVEPGRALADMHQVLTAAGDPRAETVARKAAEFLRDRSAQISDERLRADFLASPPNVRLARIAATVP
jgi:hypothetical protein